MAFPLSTNLSAALGPVLELVDRTDLKSDG